MTARKIQASPVEDSPGRQPVAPDRILFCKLRRIFTAKYCQWKRVTARYCFRCIPTADQAASLCPVGAHTGDERAVTAAFVAQPVKPLYDPTSGNFPLAREQRRRAAIVAAEFVGYAHFAGFTAHATTGRKP
jgi:hypothetical protein